MWRVEWLGECPYSLTGLRCRAESAYSEGERRDCREADHVGIKVYCLGSVRGMVKCDEM